MIVLPLLSTLLVSAPGPVRVDNDWTIFCERVYTAPGEVVENAAVHVSNGKISSIVAAREPREGDNMLRAYLFEAANAMMNLVKRDHPLREWAFRLQDKSGSKKARVALARKLAVILHAMWMSGEAFHWPDAETTA